MPARTIVWAAGAEASPIAGEVGLTVDHRRRIEVDGRMQAATGVFGDDGTQRALFRVPFRLDALRFRIGAKILFRGFTVFLFFLIEIGHQIFREIGRLRIHGIERLRLHEKAGQMGVMGKQGCGGCHEPFRKPK